MPALLDETFQKIARWVTELNPDPVGRARGGQEFIHSRYKRALSKVGLYEVASGSGPGAVGDVWALNQLVLSGAIKKQEADAYLAQKYPGQEWAGAQWGGQADIEAQRRLSDAEATRLEGKPVAASPTRSGQTADSPEVRVDPLPPRYSQEALQATLQEMADQTNRSLESLANGGVSFQPNSLDGGAIRPGSLPITALPARALQEAVQRFPGPDEAILLRHTPTTAIDRWVVSGADSGPGRVVIAQESFQSGWIPSAGPMRYRVVQQGTKFGIMSMRLPPTADLAVDFAPGFEIRYGVIIHKIPHYFGRPPTTLLAAAWVGEAPVARASQFEDGGNSTLLPATRRLFHDRAQATYQTANFPFLTSFGTDALLLPSAANMADCRGFSISLITGRTSEEVYGELNTLTVLGQDLGEESHGPSVSIPDIFEAHPPATPNVLTWNGTTSGGARYTHRTQAEDLSTFGKLIQGVPFRYEDCQRFIPTDEHFSLVCMTEVIRVNGPYTGGATPADWSAPHLWAKSGVQTNGTSPRDWALDIIVAMAFAMIIGGSWIMDMIGWGLIVCGTLLFSLVAVAGYIRAAEPNTKERIGDEH